MFHCLNLYYTNQQSSTTWEKINFSERAKDFTDDEYCRKWCIKYQTFCQSLSESTQFRFPRKIWITVSDINFDEQMDTRDL